MENNKGINLEWEFTPLSSIDAVFSTLESLKKEERWVFRGQSKDFNSIIPSIDRKTLGQKFQRKIKFEIEQKSIDLFRNKGISKVPHFINQNLSTDINTLSMLRHYGVPTRLVDWSINPYVAAYFACFERKTEPGEIWIFDYHKYVEQASKQWERCPTDLIPKDGDRWGAIQDIALGQPEPYENFFVLVFDFLGFDRIWAQSGLFSLTAFFDQNHADAISKLFVYNKEYFHRYVIDANLKDAILSRLESDHSLCSDIIYPNIPQAANEVYRDLFVEYGDLLEKPNGFPPA